MAGSVVVGPEIRKARAAAGRHALGQQPGDERHGRQVAGVDRHAQERRERDDERLVAAKGGDDPVLRHIQRDQRLEGVCQQHELHHHQGGVPRFRQQAAAKAGLSTGRFVRAARGTAALRGFR